MSRLIGFDFFPSLTIIASVMTDLIVLLINVSHRDLYKNEIKVHNACQSGLVVTHEHVL